MDRVLVAKLVLLAFGLVVAFLQWVNAPEPRSVLIGLIAVAFFWFVPDLLLLNRGMKRKQEITLKLPDTLDQLTIAVEAGLGFESALNHVARNSEGPLAEELVRTLQDMQVGVPRRVAYNDLGDRNDVPDLRRFTRAIVQAEQYGISVARVLETQAAEMRMKRKSRAEETAMKIPVKVIFPLLLCIMPALLVVVLGPAVINIISAFSGGLVGG
jgi:tight adherence protein C